MLWPVRRRDSSAHTVGFVSSGKLQSHFVDMHSGQGQVDDYDTVDYGYMVVARVA